MFAATHLANHSLGLISLAAMEAGRIVFLTFWGTVPAELFLLASLLIHAVLSLWKLWERRSLRLPLVDWVQVITGLLIPLRLISHVLGTAVLYRLTGAGDSYAAVLDTLYPADLTSIFFLLVVVWLHGCIGIHRWLRLKPLYRRLGSLPVLLAILLPVLAMLGVISGGRDFAERRASDPGWVAALAAAEAWPTPEERQRLVGRPAEVMVQGFQWLVVLLLAGRLVRGLVERRRNIRLTYPGGRTVSVPRGVSVLEASRINGIPHAAICGGQGRCSTCRVRLGDSATELPSPSVQEAQVLRRIHAAPDVRLACQLRPTGDLVVTPLMPAQADANVALLSMDPRRGVERQIVVLFADLRDFTGFSEGRLPYDTVFVLNRYFAVMGAAIEQAGGHVDKFIGDGIMALFGTTGDTAVAARAAIDATRRMAHGLRELNAELRSELDKPLRMGIGLHLGPAILGEMGYGPATSLTAVGDTVNIASRLEALTKEVGCEAILSEKLVTRSGLALDGFPVHETDLRGRSGTLKVRLVDDALRLPPVAPPQPATPPWWRRLLERVR